MMYAIDSGGTLICPAPGLSASCPLCGSPTVPKCGAIVVHHWAHRARADCDPWAERDSAWHRSWQEVVPADRREVVIGPHRADVVAADGQIVELQHSPISPELIREREQFYGRELLTWIFDATGPAQSGRLELRARRNRRGVRYTSFRWRHPRKSLAACTAQVLLDLGDDRLLDLHKLYPDAPCGGWGYLVSAGDVRAWLRGDSSQAGVA